MPAAWVASMLVGGCGGRTAEHEPGHEPGATCVVSDTCGDGLRCDDGRCVADDGCTTSGVRPLLMSVDLPLPAFTDVIGKEAQVASNDIASGGLVYIGLVSGRKSRFDDPSAFCRLPSYCLVGAEGSVTLYRDLSLDGGVWTTTQVTDIPLQPGGSGRSLGAPWSNGDVLVSDERSLYRLTVKTGSAVRLFDLSGRRPMVVIPGEPPRVVTVSVQQTVAAYEVATLDATPTWVSIANLGLFKWGTTVRSAGNDWFIFQQGAAHGPDRIDVWHASGGTADYLGTGDHMLLDLGNVSSQGQAMLPHCEARHCTLYAVNLNTLSLEQTADVEVPNDTLDIASSRDIACKGVDLVVGGEDDGTPSGVSSFYAVRLR